MDYTLIQGGGVYILRDQNSKDKWGKGNNLKRRIATLNTAHYVDLKLISVIYPTAHAKYTSGYLIHIEKQAHKILAHKRIRPDREWFNSTTRDIRYVVDTLNELGIQCQSTTIGSDLSRVGDLIIDEPITFDLNYPEEDVNDSDESAWYDVEITEYPEIHEPEPVVYRLPVCQKYEQTVVTYAEPRDSQKPVLTKLTEYFNTNERGILVLPPGYGKSYIAGFFIKTKSRVLVLTPQIQICYDFADAMTACNITSNVINSEEPDNYKSKYHVTITTYQSYLNHKKVIDDIEYDLVVYDEAHHLCANEFRQSMEIRCGKKLFMTATKKVTDYEDDSVFDMSHEDFGSIIFEQSLEDCILKGLLCDYKLYACDWKLGIASVIDKLIYEYNRKHIVLFFNRIEHSKQVCEDLIKEGLPTLHLDGNTPADERRVILDTFRNNVTILCNVNMVGEGVNLPMIDCVIFMETRSSDIGVIQNLGRGLRTYPDKDFCMVLLTDDMIKKPDVIKTLRTNDSRICSPNMIISDSVKLKYELYGVCHIVEIQSTIGMWEYKYQLCVEYEKKNTIIRSTKYKGIMLGGWIHNQKNNHEKDKLTDDQIDKLKKLNSFRTLEQVWEEKFYLCLKYEMNNTIITSTKYKGFTLGEWLTTQKKAYKKNKLSDSQINKLKQLDAFKTQKDVWKYKYQLCLKYEKKNTVVKSTKYKGISLGQWIYNQRKVYKNTQFPKKKRKKGVGILSKEQIEKLKQLNCMRGWLRRNEPDSSDSDS